MNITLIGFLKKEFTQALRDTRMRIVLFGVPIIQMTLFGVALSTEVRNVRLSVVGAPTDTMLNDTLERAVASGWFIKAEPRSADPFEQLQRGEADVVLVAPPEGLTRTFERAEGRAQVLINASNVLRAQSIEQYLLAVTREVVTERINGEAPQLPIVFDTRILYNPTLKTAVYMVPGVMSMLMCVITIILTSMSITKEKEQGTFEMLISAPVRPWEVILGKTLPFVVLGMVNFPLVLAVAIFGFGVPLRGSLLILLFAAFIFICTTVGIGILISTFAKNQQQSMMGGFLFLFPSILLSGIMFPVENMPSAMRLVAYCDPLFYFIGLLRNIMLKGGDPQLTARNLAILFGMSVAVMIYSFRRFKTTLQ